MGGSDTAVWQSVESPAWVRDAIIYEVFPRVFSTGGTFAEITARLPELKDLGVNCIWLMPIHPIGHEGRKGILGSPYSIYDYFSIDPDYGGPRDLSALVTSAHDLGIRVIMDIVANHTSNDSVLAASHPEWFCRDENGRIKRAGFGWDDVSQLNYYCNPELEAYMIEMARHWIQNYNVDGFRCDVAALVPVEFWVKFRRAIKEIKPDALLLAESHEPVHNQLAFDLTYEEWLPGVLEAIARGSQDAHSIRGLLSQQEREFPPGSLRLRYLENHDQLRAAARFGREASRAFALLLFTLDGVPLIYNGQEIGAFERPSIFDPFTINWMEGDPDAAATRELYRSLAHLRSEFSALRRGRLSFVDASGDRAPGAVLAFVRSGQGGLGPEASALVVLNLSNVAQDAVVLLDPRSTGASFGEGHSAVREVFRVGEGRPAVREDRRAVREVFRMGEDPDVPGDYPGGPGDCPGVPGNHPAECGPDGLRVHLGPWSGAVFELHLAAPGQL